MLKTLVLQSHRHPLPFSWITRCMDSVKYWADMHRFEYHFIGDELFNYVNDVILQKTRHQPIIATDLARLRALQFYLTQGFDRVVWCDADFLIFSPSSFNLPDQPFSVGREVWIQRHKQSPHKLIAYTKVHNAFLMFTQNNSFLDFYADTAERLLMLNQGTMPPQFIGPKLLTAIHNIAQCPVLETAAMFSPLVIRDIANNGGPALDLLLKKSTHRSLSANLCSSLFDETNQEKQMQQCIDTLLGNL